MKKLIWPAIFIVLVASIIWINPHRVTTVPRIVTIHDTVKVIDTAWVTKLKHDTVYKTNITERITVTPPETIKVFVHPDTVSGIFAVSVGQHVGDSTLVLGAKYIWLDSLLLHSHWQYQYWTPGPLRSLVITPSGAPSVDFYKPVAECDMKCRLKIAGIGAATITLVRALLGH